MVSAAQVVEKTWAGQKAQAAFLPASTCLEDDLEDPRDDSLTWILPLLGPEASAFHGRLDCDWSFPT